MPSHRLILEGDSSKEKWLLRWDANTFVLNAPDGQVIIEAPTEEAHRLPEIYELYAEDKVSFATPAGSLTFKRHSAAVRDIRAFLEAGLRSDSEYRLHLKSQARRAISFGLAASVICGIPFGLYCWWASWAPDPPPGHWFYWIAWPIRLVLLLLMGGALGGLVACYYGACQRLRICRIERRLKANEDCGPYGHLDE